MDTSKSSSSLQTLFAENKVLQTLREIYTGYLKQNQLSLSKYQVIQLFFDYNIIDSCGYNIFQIFSFLNQLSTTSQISLKDFFLLIFYIYKQQTTEPQTESEVTDMSVDSVNLIVNNSIQIFTKDNLIKIMVNQKENNQKYFHFVIPMISSEEFSDLMSQENLLVLSKYQQSIFNNIYEKYARANQEKKCSYLNISQLNTMIHDLPLFVNFKGDVIATYLKLFIQGITDDANEYFKNAIEQRCSESEMKDLVNRMYLNINEINFSFSSLALLLGLFAIELPATQALPFEDQVKFFLENELKLPSDDNENEEKIEEEEEEETEEEILPESATLIKAKLREQTKEDSDFLKEFLIHMDKTLPPEDEKILSFANDIDRNGSKIFSNSENIIPAKFPVDTLQIEKIEEEEKKIQMKENAMIERTKKPAKKEKAKENPFEVHMEPIPSEKTYDLKYFGQPSIETLTSRLIKSTFKDILPNTNVYPSLIQEVLMIPKAIPSKSMEIIVESFQDQIDGHLEKAIRRLEKAKDLMPISSTPDSQTEIFFNLSFGALYESLDYDLIALRYFYDAKMGSDKLLIVDPDFALVYCFMGEIFTKMKEFKWAMRCFLKAKRSREDSIGGDTPDTATVYNNLGVVCYHLQSYLPANGYFKLAYEIYKSILGITHPRTMLIKSNLRKMSQLNFNKEVQFKSLGYYPTPAQIVTNPKKKKK